MNPIRQQSSFSNQKSIGGSGTGSDNRNGSNNNRGSGNSGGYPLTPKSYGKHGKIGH